MPSNPLLQPMAGRTPPWHALGRLGFVAQSCVVAAVVGVVWLIVAPVGYALAGTIGLMQAAVAAGISLFAAEFALAISQLFRGPAAAMCGMVTGMFARMSIGMLVVVAAQQGVPALADTAIVLYLVVFYLATLAIETALLVAKIQPHSVRPIAPLPKAV